jgi:hypothetical protein
MTVFEAAERHLSIEMKVTSARGSMAISAMFAFALVIVTGHQLVSRLKNGELVGRLDVVSPIVALVGLIFSIVAYRLTSAAERKGSGHDK